MFKKSLAMVLTAVTLATTTVSGGFINPTVAYAKETNVIKITRDDCVNAMELGDSVDMISEGEYGGVLKIAGVDGYFLGVPEFNNHDDELMVYQLTSVPVVIQTNKCKYTIDSSYTITNAVSLEAEEKENEKAKINKWISDMVVCKHQSAGNVTLSASEKKGTLTVTKADIKTATKLDMMLKSKKAVTVKIKASSKTKAVNQFKSLRKLVGHSNTYGVLPWIEADQGIPFTEKIDSDRFKKSGSFYTVNISKSISKNYTYLCKAYENAFKRAEKRNRGWHFVEGTHLCDCSAIAKLRVISDLITNTHEHAQSGSRFNNAKLNIKYKDEFKALASDTKYRVYVCQDFAELAQELGYASGIASTFGREDAHTRADGEYIEAHVWAEFKVKDGSGKTVKATIDNGVLGYDSIATGRKLLNNNDSRAMTQILGHYVLGDNDLLVSKY